jgi:hypothetical protein
MFAWQRSIADPDPGSGAFLTQGKTYSGSRISYPGSQNTSLFIESFKAMFWLKSVYNSL